MKKLSILFSVVLFVFIYSCGGTTEKKEQSKEKTKKLSKSTKEGMMSILEKADIKVPSELEYEKVEKKSNSYVITFKNDSIDNETATKLAEWFQNEINKLVEAGWKKRAIRDNEEMMGGVYNEIIIYPPDKIDIDVSYGLKLSSAFIKEEMSYNFYVSAD